MKRLAKLGVFVCAAALSGPITTYAGFEYTPPAPQSAAKAVAEAPSSEAPMPIVPAPVVEAAPTSKLITPSGNEAINTQGLLEASTKGQPLSVKENPAPKTDEKLVINPYPLEEKPQQENALGTVPLEQAMMEQSGDLRPVATPGLQNTQGVQSRARIISRRDNSSGYAPVQNRGAMVPAVETSSVITPIPGGEGAPLPKPMTLSKPVMVTPAPAVPLATQSPSPAPAPEKTVVVAAKTVPAMPAQTSVPAAAPVVMPSSKPVYTDAVGFGRDLPLALALSQVVPPEYSYVFNGKVDVSTTVSWQGGKPWNEVLGDMLAPTGLNAVIDDKRVTIAGQKS